MPDLSLNRRELLAGAASFSVAGFASSPAWGAPATGLTGTLASTLGADQPAGKKYLKAVKYSMCQGTGTLLETFKLLKEVGYDGIDMDKPADHKQVLDAQEQTGLKVHGVVDYVHWAQPLSSADAKVREQGVEGLKTALRDCKTYGGTTVLLVVGVVNKDISYADCYQRTQEEIRKAIPLATELGIKILFENVWNKFLLSPMEFARYIDEFESPQIGAYFDIGNVVAFGWPEQWIRILGKRIGKLDIKEYSVEIANNMGPYKGFVKNLGEGSVNWPEVLKALDEIGYTGWGTAEMAGGGRERLEQLSQQMDKVLALK